MRAEEINAELQAGNITLSYNVSTGSKSLAKMILSSVENLLKAEDLECNALNVVLSDDDNLRKLNLSFRKIDKTTDVLSFNLLDAENDDTPSKAVDTSPLIVEGDIFVSLDRAKVQALENNSSFTEEVVRLVLHGVLHLAGWDHDDDVSLRLMLDRGEKFVRRY